MRFIKKHFNGIICLMITIVFVGGISLYIREYEKDQLAISELSASYCKIILELDEPNGEYAEYCKGSENFESYTLDTLTIMNEIIDTDAFLIFMIIAPTLIMFLGSYNANKKFRSIQIKNCITRESYKKYIAEIFKDSYIYALFLPVVIIFIFIFSYMISGHFDYSIAMNLNVSSFSLNYLKHPIAFMFCYLINLVFISIFYINISMIFIRYNKNYVVSLLESSLLYYFLCFTNTFVISGIILEKVFNITGADEYFNFLDMYKYHNVKSLSLFTILCFVLSMISSIIIFKTYKNKEKTIIALEQCGGE